MSLELDHFIGINPIPNGAIFHPDGQKYIYSSGANVVIGDLIDPHAQDMLSKHDDLVSCITLSPSGALIASGQKGQNSDIIVWDYLTKKVVFRFEEHDHMVQALAFSDDEKILASIGSQDDSNLFLWDMSNGCIISSVHKIPQGSCCVSFAGFIKDIKRRDTTHYQLVTGGKDGLVIWDVDPYSGDISPIRVTADGRANVTRQFTSVTFTDDREIMIGATTSGDYVLASLRTQKIIKATQATRMAIHSIVYNKDRILLGCGDKTIKIYNMNGDYLSQIVLDGGVVGMSLSVDKLEVLATTSFGSVARINLATSQYILIAENHTNEILKVVFDQGQNERFATVSADGTIKVWDMEEYCVVSTSFARKEQEQGAIPLCLAFANILFSGWSDGRVLAHSAETGENLWILDNANPGGVTAMALSHNRRFILTGGPSGEVRLWELRTRELISHLKEHKQKITSIQLFQDDTYALSGSRDRCILRWDLRSEKRVHCHMQRMGGINDFIITKDDGYVISVGQDRKIVLWDNRMNDLLFSTFLDGENDEGFAIAMSNDGRYVATGGSAGILRLWEVHLPNHIQFISEFTGHSKAITSIAFSLNDKQLVSCGQDGSIFVWWFFPAGNIH